MIIYAIFDAVVPVIRNCLITNQSAHRCPVVKTEQLSKTWRSIKDRGSPVDARSASGRFIFPSDERVLKSTRLFMLLFFECRTATQVLSLAAIGGGRLKQKRITFENCLVPCSRTATAVALIRESPRSMFLVLNIFVA